MCTIIVLNDCVPGYPLIIGANRDERYDRASRPPEIKKLDDVDVIVPWDDEKNGTWEGVARNGWFVGLTNQDDGHHDERPRSRGHVVVDCLKTGCHRDSAKVLNKLDPTEFNPFNLVFGRPGAMFLTRIMPGQRPEMQPLLDDVHVISNDCWGRKYDKKVDWTTRLVKSLTQEPQITDVNTVITRLMMTLSSHHSDLPDDPFQSICVHAEQHKFGTRSTSIITVSNEMDVEYFYSEGHPCSSTSLQKVARLEHGIV